MTPTLNEIILALTLIAPTETNLAPQEVICISRAIYHESRGESELSQIGTAFTVLNRVADPVFQDTICGVVYAPGQFKWTEDGKTDVPKDAEAYERAMKLALSALRGEVSDPTKGAVYFTAGPRPDWLPRSAVQTAHIGAHRFYADKSQPTSN